MGPDGLPISDYEQEAAYIRNNPAEFADFSIPWSIDFSYSFTYSRPYSTTSGWLSGVVNQSTNFNASLNLTPKWKLGANGSYNISTKQLGMLSAYLSRSTLLANGDKCFSCWVIPLFSISISPRSPLLRDLKVNRTRSLLICKTISGCRVSLFSFVEK